MGITVLRRRNRVHRPARARNARARLRRAGAHAPRSRTKQRLKLHSVTDYNASLTYRRTVVSCAHARPTAPGTLTLVPLRSRDGCAFASRDNEGASGEDSTRQGNLVEGLVDGDRLHGVAVLVRLVVLVEARLVGAGQEARAAGDAVSGCATCTTAPARRSKSL